MAEEANAQTLAMLKKSGAAEDNCGKEISFTVKLSTSGHYRGLEQVHVNYVSFIELEKNNIRESQRHFLFNESGKTIQLVDLLTNGGDTALQAPLHRAWNTHKGVEDTIRFSEKIPPAKNIYFTAAGLVFHYQPEDKPARSKMDDPQILVPFAELTDVLKTDYLPEKPVSTKPMKIYLAHGRGGSQHSKEIFHLARTAKRAGHTTHCINDTDTEDPELRSARLQRRLYAHITRDVKTLIAIHRKFQTRRVAKGSTRLYGEATQHSMRLSVDGYNNHTYDINHNDYDAKSGTLCGEQRAPGQYLPTSTTLSGKINTDGLQSI